MNHLKHLMFLIFVAAILALPACGKKGGGQETKKNVEGACECAIECANETTVDDSLGLIECKKECQKKFGAGAMISGVKRSIEVMSEVRESCAD